MEPEKPSQSRSQNLPARPRTAPDFLLSRATGSLRTQGCKRQFSSIHAAQAALDAGEVDLVVGAIPFVPGEPAALLTPETVIRTEAPLEPPAYFRGQTVKARITASLPPASEHLTRVKRAVEALRNGEADKIVLARSIEIAADSPLDPQLIAARLLDGSPRQEAYLADLAPAGEEFAHHWLVGSSPELLISRHGLTVSSHPLAGSARRHNDQRRDAEAARHLRTSAKDIAEHGYVTMAITEHLQPLCDSLTVPDSPSLTSTKEMWHLGTHITGTLKDPAPSALELAQYLHPTPAVGGWPLRESLDFITRHEEERRFYAGAVGWCDSAGNGDWVVAIRCAELDTAHNTARAWAGGGIIVDSYPATEVQETRDKLRTMMRALGISDPARK